MLGKALVLPHSLYHVNAKFEDRLHRKYVGRKIKKNQAGFVLLYLFADERDLPYFVITELRP
jgi:hypothetical protein